MVFPKYYTYIHSNMEMSLTYLLIFDVDDGIGDSGVKIWLSVNPEKLIISQRNVFAWKLTHIFQFLHFKYYQ